MKYEAKKSIDIIIHSLKKVMCRSTSGSVSSFIFPNSCQEGEKIQTKESIQQILILFCFTTFWPQLLQRFVNQTSVSLREVGVTEGIVIQPPLTDSFVKWLVSGLRTGPFVEFACSQPWIRFSYYSGNISPTCMISCHPGISHFWAEEMLLVAYHIEVTWGVAQIWEPYIEDRNVKMP